MSMTVGDLFCGTGGFSEGFRLMGFRIRWALDCWGPAAVTYSKNHPGTEVVHRNVEDLDPSELPDVDVLIGGPPCKEFSYANRGGGGDLRSGMSLVAVFLEFVDALEPRWWVMENVPRLRHLIPTTVNLDAIGESGGSVSVPTRTVLSAAEYGVPQRRTRLFCGRFPVPPTTHSESQSTSLGELPRPQPCMTLGGVIQALSRIGVGDREETYVKDPCYNLRVRESEVTDPGPTRYLEPHEVARARKVKEDHSWYGRMAFPDELGRPSRTITAVQSASSREAIILQEPALSNGPRYRLPTVREAASLQSFPITYQFYGSTLATRHRMVGNAVPVVLAMAIGREILREGGKVPPRTPLVREVPLSLAPPVHPAARRRNRRKNTSTVRFRDHISGSKLLGCRVDIDNVQADGSPGQAWVARLYVGSGKGYVSTSPSLPSIVRELRPALGHPVFGRYVRALVFQLLDYLAPRLPDGRTILDHATRRSRAEGSAPWLLDRISRLVERNLPEGGIPICRIPPGGHIPEAPRAGLPTSTLVHLLAAKMACLIVNSKAKGDPNRENPNSQRGA